MPVELVMAVAMEAARKLNVFTERHVVSEHCNPHMISNKKLNFKAHCVCCAGYFAQSHEEKTIKNRKSPREIH